MVDFGLFIKSVKNRVAAEVLHVAPAGEATALYYSNEITTSKRQSQNFMSLNI